VTLNGEDPDAVIARLQDVSGIHSISLVFKSGKDLDSLKKYALELLKRKGRPSKSMSNGPTKPIRSIVII
jgi:adenylyl- and sulfurtransferase ThiI